MPTTTIGPNKHIAPKYRVPDGGLVEFRLTADKPVKTYIVGTKNLKRFRDGEKDFWYWGGCPDPRMRQHQTVKLSFHGHWHLIILNPSKTEPVNVAYDVFY